MKWKKVLALRFVRAASGGSLALGSVIGLAACAALSTVGVELNAALTMDIPILAASLHESGYMFNYTNTLLEGHDA